MIAPYPEDNDNDVEHSLGPLAALSGLSEAAAAAAQAKLEDEPEPPAPAPSDEARTQFTSYKLKEAAPELAAPTPNYEPANELRTQYEALKKPDLKDACRARGHTISGTKEQLIARLLNEEEPAPKKAKGGEAPPTTAPPFCPPEPLPVAATPIVFPVGFTGWLYLTVPGHPQGVMVECFSDGQTMAGGADGAHHMPLLTASLPAAWFQPQPQPSMPDMSTYQPQGAYDDATPHHFDVQQRAVPQQYHHHHEMHQHAVQQQYYADQQQQYYAAQVSIPLPTLPPMPDA